MKIRIKFSARLRAWDNSRQWTTWWRPFQCADKWEIRHIFVFICEMGCREQRYYTRFGWFFFSRAAYPPAFVNWWTSLTALVRVARSKCFFCLQLMHSEKKIEKHCCTCPRWLHILYGVQLVLECHSMCGRTGRSVYRERKIDNILTSGNTKSSH